jgi:PAS domain
MRSGAVMLRDVTAEVVHHADRFDAVRHRGLRQAFQALNPGLLICHPDTFQIQYANAAARAILDIEHPIFPARLPECLTMTRQEEYCEAERRKVACYQTAIDNATHDVRAFPVYSQDDKNAVECVLVVIREYNDVSWSLFEMLDRLPIAVAAVTGEVADVRYINRRALREIYALKAKSVRRHARADHRIEDALHGFLAKAPQAGEGCSEVIVGRTKVDMHFSRLGANDGARLLYWDPRGVSASWH